MEMGRTISCSLVVSQRDLISRTLAWPIRPLHMHEQIIMSHNLVTEISQKLTCSEMCAGIAFEIDTSSLMPICLFSPPAIQEHSPCPRRYPISIW